MCITSNLIKQNATLELWTKLGQLPFRPYIGHMAWYSYILYNLNFENTHLTLNYCKIKINVFIGYFVEQLYVIDGDLKMICLSGCGNKETECRAEADSNVATKPTYNYTEHSCNNKLILPWKQQHNAGWS